MDHYQTIDIRLELKRTPSWTQKNSRIFFFQLRIAPVNSSPSSSVRRPIILCPFTTVICVNLLHVLRVASRLKLHNLSDCENLLLPLLFYASMVWSWSHNKNIQLIWVDLLALSLLTPPYSSTRSTNFLLG